MSVQYMSFSAHADAKGIMQLISYCEPRNVMLVHGEAEKMEFLKVRRLQLISDVLRNASKKLISADLEGELPPEGTETKFRVIYRKLV